MHGFLPDYGLAFWKCVVVEFTTQTEIAVLDFDVESSNNDLRQWLRLGKKCAPEPLDPDNVMWLKSKLRSCDEECVHPKPASPFLPTRLIDVGQHEENDPRLVVVEDMLNMNSCATNDLKYAALTYCWGPKEDAMKQVKTTKDTISAHHQGMPLNSLSPVIRDTIKVCRALEIRYLWVDALCIIQGDKADFHRESQTMGKIYNSCAVAICPLSSQSCLQGYLEARPEGLDVDFQSSRLEHIRGTYTLVPHSTDVDRGELPWRVSDQSLHLDIERSMWYRRGWTFQELILSPRFIVFGPFMSHFLCDTKAFSENGQILDDTNLRAGLRVSLALRSTINKAFGNGCDEMDRSVNGMRQMYQHDWKGVREVSTKDWTYREDILAGAAGIAQAFAAITGDTYLAGLWKSDLQHQLVWYIRQPFPGDLASLVDSLQDADPDAEVGGLSFSDDYESVFIEKCRFCADPMHKRAGWGLVVHPAEKSGSYVRVGAFVLFPHKGGMDLFSEEEEIVLI
ncbi:Neutral/alkaline non-lysosomal ceramidase [Colletotrichum sp. SAR 10_75]|nr:Neutral/alkaline non-lysosomal ceramidase [Colletotrichum sp. SAR 10_75]